MAGEVYCVVPAESADKTIVVIPSMSPDTWKTQSPSDDDEAMQRFRDRVRDQLAEDVTGALVFMATSRVNLQLTEERWPDVGFRKTREH